MIEVNNVVPQAAITTIGTVKHYLQREMSRLILSNPLTVIILCCRNFKQRRQTNEELRELLQTCKCK
jgi:hypothetical protein